MKKNEQKRRAIRRAKIDRATISMPKNLLDAANERAGMLRPYTLSNYVATLIEKDIATAKA